MRPSPAPRLYAWQEPLERPALRAALDLAEPGPDDRLLDVATGTGALLRELARRPDPPRRAVGLDASGAMLARAGGLPAAWELVEGDARALPFDDDAFDVVSACYLLHLLEPAERARVLAEVARVLRPGGRFAAVTIGTPRPRLRAALARMPASFSLHPLDPTAELEGFAVREARWIGAGYPSLCLLAERA